MDVEELCKTIVFENLISTEGGIEFGGYEAVEVSARLGLQFCNILIFQQTEIL